MYKQTLFNTIKILIVLRHFVAFLIRLDFLVHILMCEIQKNNRIVQLTTVQKYELTCNLLELN
jgi:hypothetical protein